MKKAMAAGVLVTLILTIIAFMLIAGVITRFTSQADDKQAELLCHDSIAFRAQTQINVDTGIIEAKVKAIPTLCKTLLAKVSGSRAEIKQQIADKIARCWWMFGEGRYEELLSGSSARVKFFGFEDNTNDCFNCYTILIDENKIDGGNISAVEMVEYLKNTKYPKLKGKTYLDYIQSVGGPGRLVYLATDVQGMSMGISPHQSYTISFAPKLKNVGESTFWNGAAKVGGALGGALIVGLATGGVGWVAFGGAALLSAVGVSGVKDIKATIYGERDVSSIYIDTLVSGQSLCGSSDIAGD